MSSGFRHIRGFIQVAKLGSFTSAAQRLHISQPTLTVQIHQLEEELGVRLFDRDRRKVSLTAAGNSLLGPMQQILDDFDAVRQHAQELGALHHGRLVMAALPTVAAAWLPSRIAKFRESYPGIEVRMIDVPSDQLQTLVSEATVDLGIGTLLSHDEGIHFVKLFEDRMHVFFPKGHELESQQQPSLKSLTRYPHISTATDSSVRQLLDRALKQARLDIEITCEVDRLSTAVSLVKAGVGIAVLPLKTLDSISCEGLIHRPIKDNPIKREIGILTSKRKILSPAATAFSSALQHRDDARQPVNK
ncbi:LysR family transcriptional regulator [Dyella sp. A6]|uniref:LysR family transcriptional regulator n=1 Tax=Dyella aluminiiresistens TaxID=3069105 RepID=UPI002E796026|nr:LysR family transcriptional regulator [Dyella sp. A6]